MPKKGIIETILAKHKKDKSRLIEIVRDVQAEFGCVSPSSIAEIAEKLDISKVEVEGVATFYHFFSGTPAGTYAVHLNNNIVAAMKGRAEIAAAFERETGAKFGGTTADGLIGLHETSCIGMSDQEPSAIINGVIFTKLTKARVKEIVAAMKAGRDMAKLVKKYGDGANSSKLVRTMVTNNIRKKGGVVFAPFKPGEAIRRAVTWTPEDVIAEIKRSNLLGRGGAGFPTGLKWEFCAREKSDRHYVVCNADEGEPGTFKDRVILTERPQLLFEGMAVAGYAVGAREGILYLRSEYAYLKAYLENVLHTLRKRHLLGKTIAGKKGFHFDVTIKMGAGAYVCGEESALLESAEGKRGEPRDRPPFPVQFGYLGYPTTVNNVETLCAAARILEKGAGWFKTMGTPKSAGTKLLSISGDCTKPGVYEVEFGLSVQRLLEMAGGRDAQAVQVGGPSGTFVPRGQFNRKIGFEDLPTGGSIIVIGPQREMFDVVRNFMDFFIEESCGSCVPCRVGNTLLRRKLEKIIGGKGTLQDLGDIESWGRIVKTMSRCGLGQTSANPILTTLQNFRHLYETRINRETDFIPVFDLETAVQAASNVTGQKLAEAHHE
jgi:[NiFe] hydrogenase diaphorase moiety large subunit